LLNEEDANICISSNNRVIKNKEKIHAEKWVQNRDGEQRLLSITKNADTTDKINNEVKRTLIER
jgi:hypothetical protein